jgi:hypothetical protein
VFLLKPVGDLQPFWAHRTAGSLLLLLLICARVVATNVRGQV